MSVMNEFEKQVTASEKKQLQKLATPAKIQFFLDSIPYSTESIYRCPLRVLREKVAHCFDGALFAAAMLHRSGQPALILELIPNRRDDDHVLALYKVGRHWGAIAKSNFSGLRFREPIFRTFRELALSYFEQYYNTAGEKTLRGYTLPLNLKTFDRLGWTHRDQPLELIAQRLDARKCFSLLNHRMISRLQPVDSRTYQAGLAGADKRGLFQPD